MMKPSRILVKKAYQVASATQATFPSSKTLYQLADMGMGAVIGSQYTISRHQRDTLRSWLSQQGINWKKPFPDKADGNRVGMSKTAINEKLAGQKEKSPWVWVAPLGDGVSINEQPLALIHESFISLRRTRDYQFQARALVLVENHDAFTQHEDLAGEFQREGLLSVYRGDLRTLYSQSWAKHISASQDIPLWGWFDFDPAGIAMALHCGAKRLLLPDLDQLTKAQEEGFQASSQDFINQYDQRSFIDANVPEQSPLRPYVERLQSMKGGFTQERLMAHEIPHRWVPSR
jgi:hypothetical protein